MGVKKNRGKKAFIKMPVWWERDLIILRGGKTAMYNAFLAGGDGIFNELLATFHARGIRNTKGPGDFFFL